MEDVERNRRNDAAEQRAPLEDDQEPGSGDFVSWWAVATMSFVAGAAVVTLLMAVAFIDFIAGALVGATAAVVIGTAFGLLVGAVAGWFASRRYYQARAA